MSNLFGTINLATTGKYMLSAGNRAAAVAVSSTNGATSRAQSAFSELAGKWYFEVSVDAVNSAAGGGVVVGVSPTAEALTSGVGFSANSKGYATTYYNGSEYTGQFISGSSFSGSPGAFVAGDTIGVALDLDAHKIWFSKNGTWLASGSPSTGANAAFSNLLANTLYSPAVSLNGTGGSIFSDKVTASELTLYDPPTGFTAANIFDAPRAFTDYDSGNSIVSNQGRTISRTTADGVFTTAKCAVKTSTLSNLKRYFEVKVNSKSTSGSDIIGLCLESMLQDDYVGSNFSSCGYLVAAGDTIRNDVQTDLGTALAAGDILSVAIDMATGKVWFAKNNAWIVSSGVYLNPNYLNKGYFPALILAPREDYAPAVSTYGLSSAYTIALQSELFTYSPPPGFMAFHESDYTDAYGEISGSLVQITGEIYNDIPVLATIESDVLSITGDLSGSVLEVGELSSDLLIITGSITARIDSWFIGSVPAIYGELHVSNALLVPSPIVASGPAAHGTVISSLSTPLVGSLSVNIVTSSIQVNVPSLTGDLYCGSFLLASTPSLSGQCTGLTPSIAELSTSAPSITGGLQTSTNIVASLSSILECTTAQLTAHETIQGRLSSRVTAYKPLSGYLTSVSSQANLLSVSPGLEGYMRGAHRVNGSINQDMPITTSELLGYQSHEDDIVLRYIA